MFSVHFCISQNVLFTTAEIIKMSFAGMRGGIICGRVCIPRDAQGMHVLGGTESLYVPLVLGGQSRTQVHFLRNCISFIFLVH